MDSTIMDYELTIKSIFWRIEKLYGNRTIVSRFSSTRKTYTYSEFAQRVRKTITFLRQNDLAGKNVASVAWNTSRHLELYFAVPLTGGVLHTVNVRFHPSEMEYVIREMQDSGVFMDEDIQATFNVKTFKFNQDYDEIVDSLTPASELPDLQERSGAVSCFTSGTTGKPKGVIYSHRSIFIHSLSLLAGDVLGLSSSDVVMDVVPMFHISGWDIPFASLMTGAKLVLPGIRPRPRDLVELIREEGVTVAAGAPTVWIDVMNYVEKEGEDLGKLRTVVMGGAEPPRGLMERMRKVGVRTYHAWGMTETEAIATVNRSEDLDALTKQGYPIFGFEIALLDPEGKELPWDGKTVGELAVRGAFVTGRYFKGDRTFTWFRTGDVATVDPDGNVKVVDRQKDLIKSGGEWISSVQLENAIMSFNKVLEAVVVGVPHERWGERPVALVVTREPTSPQEIVDYLKSLRAFPDWWIPDRIVFVDSIPKTSTGKLDKKVVREEVKKLLQIP
ncbi:4-hydroxybutyrate--CoA ligase 2 [Metallosphaera sp. J1]|uniref:AMP-binding protein n=1 Tax=Metallosphaera TaxID=41980 RepID=UPI001EE00CBB|nr:AMP-binding protein [Metallosphaera javensis (ex Hofmann et al. 2022)]MCG3109086.1 4-hydroxybutyrate--CoA ligase 2 [Metallosphaera javensis (ex Hofmann et al. 2022)]BCS93624.1 MAG: 4-hydroxybutyrate--CoA ligase 2 [Metallosphaera javensis (ex Sakai et al. 2022)]